MGPCRGLTEFLKSKTTNIHEIWLGDAQQQQQQQQQRPFNGL